MSFPMIRRLLALYGVMPTQNAMTNDPGEQQHADYFLVVSKTITLLSNRDARDHSLAKKRFVQTWNDEPCNVMWRHARKILQNEPVINVLNHLNSGAMVPQEMLLTSAPAISQFSSVGALNVLYAVCITSELRRTAMQWSEV